MIATRYADFLIDSVDEIHQNWKVCNGRDLSPSEIVELGSLLEDFFLPKRVQPPQASRYRKEFCRSADAWKVYVTDEEFDTTVEPSENWVATLDTETLADFFIKSIQDREAVHE
jgi:hypothetical protein